MSTNEREVNWLETQIREASQRVDEWPEWKKKVEGIIMTSANEQLRETLEQAIETLELAERGFESSGTISANHTGTVMIQVARILKQVLAASASEPPKLNKTDLYDWFKMNLPNREYAIMLVTTLWPWLEQRLSGPASSELDDIGPSGNSQGPSCQDCGVRFHHTHEQCKEIQRVKVPRSEPEVVKLPAKWRERQVHLASAVDSRVVVQCADDLEAALAADAKGDSK